MFVGSKGGTGRLKGMDGQATTTQKWANEKAHCELAHNAVCCRGGSDWMRGVFCGDGCNDFHSSMEHEIVCTKQENDALVVCWTL
jgi:hypothetical protein